ncbi:hypothetical protein H5U35_10390, partial [Candidatus Aerophobetes bacterium]|nr:hypothetical protein [Candidatus Aerophobetes bacterium]
MSTYLAVAFNLPVRKLFWYKASSSFRGEFQIGQRVVAPFRNKNLKGFIAEISEKHPGGKLKEIESIFDKTSPFSIFLIRLAFWMADYYACSLGQVFHSIFPFSYPYDGEDEQTEDGKEKSSNSKEPLVYVVNPGEDRFFFFSDLIKKTLSQQKKALILVPEIGLIDGFQKRLQKHGISSMIFHSKLPSKERYRRWIAMKKGEVDVVVGTRSGVFAPLKEIGLILVDQEESLEYKQKETPKYSVHKVALKRGEIEGFPVYLSTYSPSLDSWYKVKTKKYRKISVKSEKKSFLEVVVDLKKEPKKNRIFSGILQEKIKEALEEKSSILLFVPRRGYASFLLCDDCGEVIRCPDCSITLNFHLGREMVCHWCGFRKKAPSLCP